MRVLPRSIAGRLIGIATLTTIVALAFAAVSIGQVLERFVIRGLDQQLDAQAAMLARAVQPDGTLDRTRIVNLPAFESGEAGWGWRVDGKQGHWFGGDVIVDPVLLTSALTQNRPRRRPRDPDRARPGDGTGSTGEPVHFRQISIATTAGPVVTTAAGPRRVAVAPLHEAMVPLLGSLGLLGAALALATALQLRFGLQPLRQLHRDVGEVRAGRLRHVPANQPVEVAPLAAELNALIDQNEAQLDHARRHVANLAHGLKTPLAALSVRLAESGYDLDGSLSAMVAGIDGRVRHHLGRARAAAPGGSRRARTPLAPAVTDIVSVLQRIHADLHVRAVVAVAPALTLTMDPHDLDELVGNLLDNAWRHARSEVRVAAHLAEGKVEIAIDDDGPGLTEAAMHEALVPGRRLDEGSDGHGFGLSIAQELAELNGGGLVLGRSVMGGLSVMLTLPMASERHEVEDNA